MHNELKKYINPSEGELWAKIHWLHDRLANLDVGQNEHQQKIHRTCQENLALAESLLKPSWRKFLWLPLRNKNHTLVWELLHRIDEDLILLIPEDELYFTAMDVKTAFDMNVKEDKVRGEWLGRPGQNGNLTNAVTKLAEPGNTQIILTDGQIRYIIKGALHKINEQMDREFWKLNLNTLMSVLSGLCLAITVAIYIIMLKSRFTNEIMYLGGPYSCFLQDVISVGLLGIMGCYLSNTMTSEGFIFVYGPYYRYLLHPIMAKPVMSAFVAVFIYLVEKSHLIFSIGKVPQDKTMDDGFIILNVGDDHTGYVYAVLAVVSGFSADKMFRSMIDRVLARLEAKADKDKEVKNSV